MAAKLHAGTHNRQGSQHRGTAPKPSPQHGGSGRLKGTVHHGVQPRQYGLHAGTHLAMGVLKGKRT
jgi:hypothetical protein